MTAYCGARARRRQPGGRWQRLMRFDDGDVHVQSTVRVAMFACETAVRREPQTNHHNPIILGRASLARKQFPSAVSADLTSRETCARTGAMSGRPPSTSLPRLLILSFLSRGAPFSHVPLYRPQLSLLAAPCVRCERRCFNDE